MTRNGGQMVVSCLEALGARRAFGVPGESYLAVLDALHDSEIAFVNCRHEGGASFMAAAHGKLTGQPGICMVTRGPGATNAAIGVHTAAQDSAPMLLLVGQIGTDMREREAFQEVNYRAVFGTMAKWVTEIDEIARIPELLSRAWTVSTSGRPGPVVIALPENMLMETTDAGPIAGPIRVHAPEPAAQALSDARALLSGAQRPLILLGGAPWERAASAALQQFAEASGIPVISSFRYQDQYDNLSPTFCGDAGVGMAAGVKSLLREADVILALGTRFGENMTDGYSLLQVPQPAQKIIHVHVSEAEIGKVYRPEIGVHACPQRFSLALGAGLQGPWSDWLETARTAYLDVIDKAPQQPGPVDMVAVTAHLRERLKDADLVLTNGAGNFTVWSSRFFRFRPGMRLLAPQSGSMGYGLPAAVAAKLERPQSTVICFAGDGDVQMTMMELATARQAGAAIIVIVVNNGTYGTIRAHQEREFPARVSATDLLNPDFAAVATACGMHGERVSSTERFADAFERALAAPHGALLELTVSKEALTPYRTLTQIRERS
ncbi:thiamine pyrophosphate-binding protein [Citreicella sp. C3M06]|uniref:thiamine pyrophosphate-dependent enzyme n=1 Tax=Citreicella sp. C3M06 TaxID=2841564 RepID=UPI001C0944BD|nr:thiamine pyrophosphate-dependent enzyme [Citreicella sp. C3M06]MBU2961151.1 thiamine pyrophosphate-binding protein [Citreicella sp. C3M06]